MEVVAQKSGVIQHQSCSIVNHTGARPVLAVLGSFLSPTHLLHRCQDLLPLHRPHTYVNAHNTIPLAIRYQLLLEELIGHLLTK